MRKNDIKRDLRYLQLLSQRFPTIAEASTEIINLQAILNLPKGTEHFLADLHGEYKAFQHVLKNASGNIKRKVNDIFGNTLRENEKRELCTLIYYPEQKIQLVKAQEDNLNDWYHITIHQLVSVCRDVSSKDTRSKVRKALPEDFAYIIEELLHESTDDHNKAAYVNVIISTIISTGRADDFICAIAGVIQRLAIDQLHILGDIFDRGTGPTSFSIRWPSTTNGTSRGETTTSCGWVLQQATTPASATSSGCRCAMPTCAHWRMAMASVCCRWQRGPWSNMTTTNVQALPPLPAEAHANSTRRQAG